MLVVVFEGWNDAGDAASGVGRLLRDGLGLQARRTIDAELYLDYQFTRPTAVTEDGRRRLVWPSIVLYGPARPAAAAPSREVEIGVLIGTEPSRSWQSFAAEVMDLVLADDYEGIVFVGSMLADVPHTRPISVVATSENAHVRARLGVERSGYEGPVGILAVLSDAAETLGIPTLSLWASLPHYVNGAPSPKATLALVEALEPLLGVSLPRGELPAEAERWEHGIDQLAEDDEDMAAYIRQLEQARDTVDSPSASGEAIAEEFEQYLRRRDGRDGRDGGTADGRRRD